LLCSGSSPTARRGHRGGGSRRVSPVLRVRPADLLDGPVDVVAQQDLGDCRRAVVRVVRARRKEKSASQRCCAPCQPGHRQLEGRAPSTGGICVTSAAGRGRKKKKNGGIVLGEDHFGDDAVGLEVRAFPSGRKSQLRLPRSPSRFGEEDVVTSRPHRVELVVVLRREEVRGYSWDLSAAVAVRPR